MTSRNKKPLAERQASLKKRMTVATQTENNTQSFADELTKIVMKVAAKMPRQEREDRLNQLNQRLSVKIDKPSRDRRCFSKKEDERLRQCLIDRYGSEDGWIDLLLNPTPKRKLQ